MGEGLRAHRARAHAFVTARGRVPLVQHGDDDDLRLGDVIKDAKVSHSQSVRVIARLVEPTIGHHLRLSLVLLVGEAFDVLKQHLGVSGQDRPIDMPAPIPER